MGHYFTNEDIKSEKRTFTFDYFNHTYTFNSDNGVFSKNSIDYGSRVLLNTIAIDQEQTLLDVGCGYGTMGMMLKGRYPQLTVTMVDVNKRALELAKENVKINNLEDITIFESNIYDQVKDCYDIIISNPPIRAGKKVVHAILEDAYNHLNENGRLIIVIQKKQGAPSAKAKMFDTFGNVEILKKDKGYYILQSYKKSAEK